MIGLTFAGVLASAVIFLRGRTAWAVAVLVAAALAVNVFAATLDPFLHEWDERYHALVAKNMLDHPFKPVLRADPVLPYDHRQWWDIHVWLHKQPLFLWQIAASFAVLGIHEWTLRLPMVLMTTLLVPVLFRMGVLIANATVGYAAAMLFPLAYYHSGGGFIYNDPDYRQRRIHNSRVYRRLGAVLSPKHVVMNVKPLEFVDVMFYSGLPAYDRLPTPEEHAMLLDRGRLLAVFDDGDLPPFLADDDRVTKLRMPEFELR